VRTRLQGPDRIEVYFELIEPSTPSRANPNDELNIVITLGGVKGCSAARPVAECFARELNARVLIWDRRNTHSSGIGYNGIPLVLEDVEDLHALIVHVFGLIKPCILVGSSSGARVSALLAVKYPNLCAGLMFAPPTGGDAVELLARSYYDHPSEVIRKHGIDAMLALDDFKDLNERSKNWLRTKAQTEAVVATLETTSRWMRLFTDSTMIGLDENGLLSLKRFPVCVVHDGNILDQFHTIRTAFKVATALSLSAVHLVPGVLKQTPESSKAMCGIIRANLLSKLNTTGTRAPPSRL